MPLLSKRPFIIFLALAPALSLLITWLFQVGRQSVLLCAVPWIVDALQTACEMNFAVQYGEIHFASAPLIGCCAFNPDDAIRRIRP